MKNIDNSLLNNQIYYYDQISEEYTREARKTSFSTNGKNFSKLILSFIDPGNNCLEIGSGPGIWTKRLLKKFSTITAIDSSLKMIDISKNTCNSNNISYICANFFSNPIREDIQFDCVFGAFWISHIPLSCYIQFWQKIHSILKIGDQAIFIDSYPYATKHSGNLRKTSNDENIKIIKNNYSSNKFISITNKIGFKTQIFTPSNYTYLIKATKVA